MWQDESVFYQIYPLGFCGAPQSNDGKAVNRIQKVADWIPHLLRLGVNAVYFSPLFSSDAHGYDTRSYTRLDERLGTNADFAAVCRSLHEAGIRVVLDGVFNHVGRGFWAFQDVLKNREASPYRDWFYVDFSRNNAYGDGLFYEGWEGHYDLVKLNLNNPEVIGHLFGAVAGWVREFGIDGLRLDVAYQLDEVFLRRLRAFTSELKPDFFLVGEIIHGDYNRIVNDSMLHSCTNYECYKGLYSAFNSMNLFEIAHSLNRQFGKEAWCLYPGKRLMCFADNHDVARVASVLKDARQLPPLYAVLFGMPGIPCVYYGSEWGAAGEKRPGSDWELRPAFPAPEWNALAGQIAEFIRAHREEKALQTGSFETRYLTNRQFVFERAAENERVLVAVNAEDRPAEARFDARAARGLDLLRGEKVDLTAPLVLAPFGARYIKVTE